MNYTKKAAAIACDSLLVEYDIAEYGGEDADEDARGDVADVVDSGEDTNDGQAYGEYEEDEAQVGPRRHEDVGHRDDGRRKDVTARE